jgi:predicted permease
LALSVVLLIGAGLLIRSFARIQSVAPGFDAKSVLTFDLAMTGRKYADRQTILNTYRQLWERLRQLPGVTDVGGISALPLSDALSWTPITIEGRQPPPGEKFINADARTVAASYFQTMKIPLRRGRFFNENDVPENPRTVIVDEHFAERYWPNEDPIGKRIHIVQMAAANPWQTIVGVVGRVKHESLDSDPRIVFYLAHTQSARRAMTVAVRSRIDPASLTSSIKHEVLALDPDLPIYGMRTMEDRTAGSLARRRFSELLLAIFAALALVLAAIGTYGVMAYMVSQGTRELGIRIALGATQRGILSLVVRQGMTLALSGVGIGLIAAFALTRFMSSLLFGVGATDALTFSATAGLLTLVALVASAIPARRASRIDPMVSLRAD